MERPLHSVLTNPHFLRIMKVLNLVCTFILVLHLIEYENQFSINKSMHAFITALKL